jgi:hypothetical protein
VRYALEARHVERDSDRAVRSLGRPRDHVEHHARAVLADGDDVEGPADRELLPRWGALLVKGRRVVPRERERGGIVRRERQRPRLSVDQMEDPTAEVSDVQDVLSGKVGGARSAGAGIHGRKRAAEVGGDDGFVRRRRGIGRRRAETHKNGCKTGGKGQEKDGSFGTHAVLLLTVPGAGSDLDCFWSYLFHNSISFHYLFGLS